MPELDLRAPDPRNYFVPGRVSMMLRKKGGTLLADWIDVGHVQNVSIRYEQTQLDHFSNRRGERVKDRSLIVERQVRVSWEGHEWNFENLRLMFGSTKAPNNADTVLARDMKIFKNPGNGGVINLGAANLAGVVVRSEGLETVVTYVAPTDYTVDLVAGTITIAAGALTSAGAVPRIHIAWEKSVTSESFEGHDGGEIEGEVQLSALKGGDRVIIKFPNAIIHADGDINLGEGADWARFNLLLEVMADENGEMLKVHRVKENQTF